MSEKTRRRFTKLEVKYAEKFGEAWPYEYGTGREAEAMMRRCLKLEKPVDDLYEIPDGTIV